MVTRETEGSEHHIVGSFSLSCGVQNPKLAVNYSNSITSVPDNGGKCWDGHSMTPAIYKPEIGLHTDGRIDLETGSRTNKFDSGRNESTELIP